MKLLRFNMKLPTMFCRRFGVYHRLNQVPYFRFFFQKKKGAPGNQFQVKKGTHRFWVLKKEEKKRPDTTPCASLGPGWWFEIFLIFIPNLGEMIQFDEHIFQMG